MESGVPRLMMLDLEVRGSSSARRFLSVVVVTELAGDDNESRSEVVESTFPSVVGHASKEGRRHENRNNKKRRCGFPMVFLGLSAAYEDALSPA